MFGHTEDVKGECNARLYCGDDFGDNETTFRCQLKPKHKGKHCEKFSQPWVKYAEVIIKWDVDECNYRRNFYKTGRR